MNLTVKKDAKQNPEQTRRYATQAPALPGNAFPSSTKKTSREPPGTSEAPNAAELVPEAHKGIETAVSMEHTGIDPRPTWAVSMTRGEGLEGGIVRKCDAGSGNKFA